MEAPSSGLLCAPIFCDLVHQLPPLRCRCVVTVPPHFEAPQRSATGMAAALAGVGTYVTLYEPVAAALAYGLNLQDFSRVLVCDLGGGTFDVSVIETGCESVEVMGVAGDGRLGGNDWDRRVARWRFSPPARLKLLIRPLAMSGQPTKLG